MTEFKELVEKAKKEHAAKTPAALVEENLKELDDVLDYLTNSVLRSSLERLDEEVIEISFFYSCESFLLFPYPGTGGYLWIMYILFKLTF